jgi:pimeloyl-ACP methyl ester carboxylesterase
VTHTFDAGSGDPVMVVVPGITGRWEWIEPALQGLAEYGRTIGYSLRGGRTASGAPGFDAHVEQLAAVVEAAGGGRVVLCGVSLGGWIALRYAARHPSEVAGLVLASAPGPRFALNGRQQHFVRWPRALAPLFVATAHGRLGPEVAAAIPDAAARWRFRRRQLWRIARAPASPVLMSRRIAEALEEDFVPDCRTVAAPTLVLTGEAHLDRVVPVASTREYLREIAGAQGAVLPRTGHLGIVTRPGDWARLVGTFARATGRRKEAR